MNIIPLYICTTSSLSTYPLIYLWKSLKKLKIELPYIHQSHSWTCIWRKTCFKRMHTPRCSLQHCLQQPKHERNLKNIYFWLSTACGIFLSKIIHSVLYQKVMPNLSSSKILPMFYFLRPSIFMCCYIYVCDPFILQYRGDGSESFASLYQLKNQFVNIHKITCQYLYWNCIESIGKVGKKLTFWHYWSFIHEHGISPY